MRDDDVLPVGATPFRAALWVVLICGLFGAGVFVGAAVIAPAQAENRAGLTPIEMRPPDEATDIRAAIHECRQAGVATDALVERLEYEWRTR